MIRTGRIVPLISAAFALSGSVNAGNWNASAVTVHAQRMAASWNGGDAAARC